MTIINPNSIAGITSVTAEAGVMNFYKSDGTLAGLQLNGVNFNTTSGISTFNNVYVGGTITYEDVKNVDSVGIVTARAGIKVPDDQRIRLGAANDLDIYHTTSGTSWIRHGNTSEYFVIEGDQMDFRSYTNSHYRVRMGTAVELRHNNIERLKTSSTGVTITGDITTSDKIIHAGDTDTAIRFPSADTISVENAGAESFRVDSSGRTLIGSTSSRIAGDVTAQLQVEGTSYHTSSLGLIANAGASSGNNPHITLAKSRGSSDGSNTILVDGDSIGIIQWAASDGTDLNCVAAEIRAVVDGTPGSNDMPGRIVLGTTADGAVAPTERLRISADGGVKLSGHSERSINALGNTTGSTTIDFTTADIITATLTGTTTFANPTTESVGQSGSIVLTQDGTGSRTASWGSQFKWVGGTAPTLTTTASAVDRIDYLVVAADTIHCVASLDVK